MEPTASVGRVGNIVSGVTERLYSNGFPECWDLSWVCQTLGKIPGDATYDGATRLLISYISLWAVPWAGVASHAVMCIGRVCRTYEAYIAKSQDRTAMREQVNFATQHAVQAILHGTICLVNWGPILNWGVPAWGHITRGFEAILLSATGSAAILGKVFTPVKIHVRGTAASKMEGGSANAEQEQPSWTEQAGQMVAELIFPEPTTNEHAQQPPSLRERLLSAVSGLRNKFLS